MNLEAKAEVLCEHANILHDYIVEGDLENAEDLASDMYEHVERLFRAIQSERGEEGSDG